MESDRITEGGKSYIKTVAIIHCIFFLMQIPLFRSDIPSDLLR